MGKRVVESLHDSATNVLASVPFELCFERFAGSA